MRYRLRLLALAVLVALTPSCFLSRSRVNEPIDTQAYGRLAPGQSNQDDVLRELGAPADIVQLGARSAWRYDHTHSKSTGVWPVVVVLQNVDTVQDRVWAFFDGNGLLTNIGATFQAADASYKLPFQD